jgi:hypothetical protein
MTVAGADWSGDWVVSAIAARVDRAGSRPVSEDHKPGLVPSEVNWLIDHLAKINSTGRSDDVLVQYACKIMYCVTALRFRGRGPVRVVGNTEDRFVVREAIVATGGLARQLLRLERAARSGSMARWMKAWAASSLACRRLVWRPDPPPFVRSATGIARGKLRNIVGIDGVLIGPRPADALPAIISARRALTSRPPGERQGNKPNQEAAAVADALRSVVRDLTGRVGVTNDRIAGKTTGALVHFGAAFDDRFGTQISWRLIEKVK